MFRTHVDDYDVLITKKYFKMGNEEKDDVFRFVAYWLAFIQLVNFECYGHERIGETRKIKDYCESHSNEISQLIDFDAPYMSIFKERPVVKGTERISRIHGECSREDIQRYIQEQLADKKDFSNSNDDISQISQDFKNINDPEAKTSERIKSVFCSIYRVRCNLFHGSKISEPERDARLICASADILGLCLESLIQSTYANK